MSAVPPPGFVQADAWFIACTSAELRSEPRAVTIQSKPLVLFRARGGAPTALLDRCPHRNVPLSMGRVRSGEIACAYHGWRFDGAGQCVAVLGCGGLGLIGIAILQALGHGNIIACDIDDAKLEVARAAGVQHVLNLKTGGPTQLLALAKGGLSGMIDFVGAPATSALALPSLRKGGRFVSVGLFGGATTIPLVALAMREVAVMGSAVGSTEQMRELVALVRSGKLALPTVQVRPLAQAEQSLQDLEAGHVTGRIVLDTAQ